MAEKSAAERLRELEQERNALIEQARNEALDRVNLAVSELNALGIQYRLVRGGDKKGARRKAAGAACPICQIKTEPPHDGRAHRSQGERKRAFTPKQLEERGFNVL